MLNKAEGHKVFLFIQFDRAGDLGVRVRRATDYLFPWRPLGSDLAVCGGGPGHCNARQPLRMDEAATSSLPPDDDLAAPVEPAAPAAPASPEVSLPRPHLLVVDDDDLNRDALARRLERRAWHGGAAASDVISVIAIERD